MTNHQWTGPTKAAESMHPDLRWENPALFNIVYNPDNGEFRWVKIPRGARRDGVCGTIHTDRRGYRSRIISAGGYSYKAHRIAWFKVYGLPIPKEIDHVDGDGTNNAIKNLRASDSSKNKRNRHMQSNNVSGFTGVRRHSNGNGWIAAIQVNGKSIHLGYFMNLEEAIRARVSAEQKYNFTPRHGRKKRNYHEC